jgi:hypothetical protein
MSMVSNARKIMINTYVIASLIDDSPLISVNSKTKLTMNMNVKGIYSGLNLM